MRTLSGFVIFILAVGITPSLALPSTRAVLSRSGEQPDDVIDTTPNKQGSWDNMQRLHLENVLNEKPHWVRKDPQGKLVRLLPSTPTLNMPLPIPPGDGGSSGKRKERS
ncbi:hypothetical protein F5148DRAFT_1223323 [Russula earlei]|uniref:Uncharacterized protein n=1 Tax=Russula earlei TaxID=71964 RepID=A0ACC0U0W0_9AGAM|nr:hypothetical protein F5148DRAFT_1223323 [Russula earlei]